MIVLIVKVAYSLVVLLSAKVHTVWQRGVGYGQGWEDLTGACLRRYVVPGSVSGLTSSEGQHGVAFVLCRILCPGAFRSS